MIVRNYFKVVWHLKKEKHFFRGNAQFIATIFCDCVDLHCLKRPF